MKAKAFLLLSAVIILVQCTTEKTLKKPPLAEVKPVEDIYFGKKIVDRYRHMENLKDSAVIDWMKAHADYSRSILNGIPGRQKLIDKMREFDGRKSSRISRLKITENNRYFYLKTTPDDETGKLYYRDGYEGTEYLLYDPQQFSNDTTQKFTISFIFPSHDGTKVAFEIAPNGSENSVLLTMDVENKSLFPEQIDRCTYAMPSWLPDGSGYLYTRLQTTGVHDVDRLKDSKIYLHFLGSDPKSDKEIFSRRKYPDLGIKPEDFPVAVYDKDCRYMFGFLYTVASRLNAFYAPVTELSKNKINWKRLFKLEDEVYSFHATNDALYVHTFKNAPNYKIVKTSLKNPDLANAEVVVAENPNAPLTTFALTNEALYYTLSKNGVEEKLYRLLFGEKTAEELKLPFTAGSISLTTKGYKYSDVWTELSGWTSGNKRYRYLPQSNKFKSENLTASAAYPEYADLIVEELMVTSHDGVKVPLSLIYKKGMVKDGSNPVFFYGYGAYGVSMNPKVKPNLLLWAHEGGILAIAHVRGGGELGKQWHESGKKTAKPNTWKDLIACAEYMVTENYTAPKKIAINGGSAGGVLIGRAMTERPDLFAVAIPEVGCLHALRFEETVTGSANVPEFGTVKDSVECMALIEMDAYLHVKDGIKYPASLITAGMNDPRVIAWIPAKFAARLQAANASEKPILFLADFEAGHGIGNTKTKQFESWADVVSFALWQTGHPDYQVE